MSTLERFRSEYLAAFRDYLTGGGELGLESAYELGRAAVTGELSLLDLARIHHDVLAESLRGVSEPAEIERVARAGTDFFLESLSTFEMTQRGFREAQEAAQLQQRHAGRLRGLADAALAISSAQSVEDILELVGERAREIIGAERSLVSMRTEEETPRPLSGWLSAPLIDREGRNLGFIQLADKHEGVFDADDEAMLVQLAQMTSVAVENTRLYEHERNIAVTLQRNLLPASLPDLPGVATAARYLAGGAGVEVGGDWYEVIPLSGERVGVAIGDVVGRGVRAASTMGQLRIALRAYALEFDSPAEVAGRLAGLARTLDPDQMATCVYAVLDSATNTLTYTNAGHLPPLVLGGDGQVSYLESHRSLPLGVVADPEYSDSSTVLEDGATLLLYTDGLVEERGEIIDAGIERLRAAAAAAPQDPEQLCDYLLEALQRGAPVDDVALLAVRAAPVGTEPLDVTLPAVPDSLGPARRALRGWLRHAGASPEETHDIVLAVSEAASNAVEHAYGPGDAVFQLQALIDDGDVAVSVTDFGRWREQRDPRRGRGLGVMREAMDSVDVSSGEEGTKVCLRRRLLEGASSGGARPHRGRN